MATLITILDGATLNPGDLDWSALETLGPTTVYPRTAPDQVIPRAAAAAIVLTNKVVLDAAAINALPRLRYIGVLATGYNVVDLDAARARNVIVSNGPAYGTASVAQMTFALILELTQQVGHHAQRVRDGAWTRSADFCFWDRPLVELDSLTLGIVGLGLIGRQVAAIGRAFGMTVIASESLAGSTTAVAGVDRVPLDDLFRRSDVVTLHCPLTPATNHLVNRQRLALMKPSALLINTARGPLIDETALADALNREQIAGAGLDVLSVEPPPADQPLFGAKHCLLTPHIAWATRAARQRLMDLTVDNVRAFLAGHPQHVVT